MKDEGRGGGEEEIVRGPFPQRKSRHRMDPTSLKHQTGAKNTLLALHREGRPCMSLCVNEGCVCMCAFQCVCLCVREFSVCVSV